MYLHEYMAKEILKESGVPVPDGFVITNLNDLEGAYERTDGKRSIVKAQVHAGGRGKAGGVRAVETRQELECAVKDLLGKNLVTYQTTEKGQPVNAILVEQPCDIKRELYLAVTLDRKTSQVVCMISGEGGVDIESVAQDKIHRFAVSLITGISPFQCREVGYAINLSRQQISQLYKILTHMYNIYMKYDLAMLEINPLIIDGNDNLVCLDAKMSIDDNALYRQPRHTELQDLSQDDEREIHAKKHELSYIALDGQIGCMVNGAGLAMATMDLIKISGGSPANFLDVGGSATAARVTEAFKIILSDVNVKVIFINIFGGIVSCAVVAEGIIKALSHMQTKLPVVVRLIGNNHEKASKMLSKSGLNIHAVNDFASAAQKAVELAKSKEF